MLSKNMLLNKTQEDLSQNMANVLSENKNLQYAKFTLKTMTMPDGRTATFSFVLEPIEEQTRTEVPQAEKLKTYGEAKP